MEPLDKRARRVSPASMASAKVNRQQLKLSGSQLRSKLGPNAKLTDLQRYVSDQLAGVARKATTADLLGSELSKAGNAASLHISLSWG